MIDLFHQAYLVSPLLDVVKVRLMNDKAHEFENAFDCVRQIMVKEGPFGFFKGFGMCWARVRLPLHLSLPPVSMADGYRLLASSSSGHILS